MPLVTADVPGRRELSRSGSVVAMAASSPPRRGSRLERFQQQQPDGAWPWRTRDLRSTRDFGQTDRCIPAANHI